MTRFEYILFFTFIAAIKVAYAQDPNAQKAEESLSKQARQLTHEVTKVRGLKAKRKISMGVMTKDEILSLVKKRMAKEYTKEELAIESLCLQQLGFLPNGIDYENSVQELLAEQVAGFYDPHTRNLNIASWIPILTQIPALAHEICHALQDQYFNLLRFVKPIKDNSDQQLARTALVEGDCTGVMIEHLMLPLGKDLSSLGPTLDSTLGKSMASFSSPVFEKAPMYLRETLIFPYIAGLKFITQLREKNDWAMANKMFFRPPQTTEQILHYEKYWKKEKPVLIKVKTLPALSEYKQIKVDTLGEFQLDIYLRQAVAKTIAQRAAAGWGGDRLVAFQKENDDQSLPILIHLSTWDSEADAIEFANAQLRVLAKRCVKALYSSSPLWIYKDSNKLQWSVQLHEKNVLTLIAVPSFIRAQLQHQVWDKWLINGKKIKSPKMTNTH